MTLYYINFFYDGTDSKIEHMDHIHRVAFHMRYFYNNQFKLTESKL